MMLHPFPDTFDPYGKDLPKATTGVDNIFRLTLNEKGLPCRVTSLSKEEADEYRKDNATPSHRRRA